jgi:hypothetical protein
LPQASVREPAQPTSHARSHPRLTLTTVCGSAITVLALAVVACGGGSKNPSSTAAPTSAAAASTAAAAGTSRPATPSATPPRLGAISTPNPVVQAAADKLTPLLLQQDNLPAGERAFVLQGTIPNSNADYGRGRPDAATIQQRLDRDGRLGGVVRQWFATGGPYTPAVHAQFTVDDVLSEFQTADGAKDGLALIFSDIKSASPGTQSTQAHTKPLDIGTIGDESQAYNIFCRQLVLNGTPTPTTQQLDESFNVAAWRRGTVVASVELGAINQDASLDDFKQLVQAQDQRLKSGGF